jgi:oligopeptide/dipeptide ABC transporter ATP-binding protein
VDHLLEVTDLHVEYARESGSVPVLNGVDLTVSRGESVGVVGESGVGKTVLVRAVLGLLEPPWRITRGEIRYEGEDLRGRTERELRAIRGRGIALTTHEPRKHLNPVLPIGEQIVAVVRAHGDTGKTEARQRAVALLRMVGLPDPEARLRAYPHELSGGMCQRVIIAMALAHSPKLLMADEPTAGLDVTISLQVLDLMQGLVRDANSSLLLVSRDLGVVAHYCQRVAVMYQGRIVESADVVPFFAQATHPYSRRLLRAAAAARDDRRSAAGPATRRGGAPALGCAYAPRCPVPVARCTVEAPALAPVTPGHLVRCFLSADIAARRVTV